MKSSKILLFSFLLFPFLTSSCSFLNRFTYLRIPYDDQKGNEIYLYASNLKYKSLDKPVLVFYHGGAWQNGTPLEFHRYCRYFSQKGYLCIAIEYGLVGKTVDSPVESLHDCIEAYNFIRGYLSLKGMGDKKLVLIGGSAGAHLAYWVTLQAEDSENQIQGLALLNPVINTTETGYGAEIFKKDAIRYSPLHNVNDKSPPCLIVHSQLDEISSQNDVDSFVIQMESFNNPIEYRLLDGALHGEYYWRDKHEKPESLITLENWLLDLEL